jgi:hypothetical protein
MEYANMVKSLQPNDAQKQVLLELVQHVNIRENPKQILPFAYAAVDNPTGAKEFLSNLSRLEPNLRSQEFSGLFAKGKISFLECAKRFNEFATQILLRNTADEIHNAMQSNLGADGLIRATQGATEIAKHLITASGQLADEGFIFGLKSMLAEGKILPGLNNAFVAQQLDRLLSDEGLQAQLMNIGKNGISTAAQQAIRQTLGLSPDAPITAKEAQQAALAAMLSPLRQGKVGSCFATSAAINIHDTRPSEMLRDMASLIEKGCIERTNGYARIQVPFNQSIFTGTQTPTVSGNPLLRCWEYTLATSAENQSCSNKSIRLRYVAEDVLSSTEVDTFMQHVSFEYDANKRITHSADGHSTTGAFRLTYTSPRDGRSVEIQTPEQLRDALQESARRPLAEAPDFLKYASEEFFEHLNGENKKFVLQAQYGIQDIHETTIQNFQHLPGRLLGIAGKIASEAQRRGVPVPSYAPMSNGHHAFNIRLNDPILQEGIRTGAWESSAKRWAFLRQQLIEPMEAKTLEANDVRSTSFFDNIQKYIISSIKPPPSKEALGKVFDDVMQALQSQGKFSYEDLAIEIYNALRDKFRINANLIIMSELAPHCPQMMFADTNWERDGKPIHWGIQYNPIDRALGLVKGVRGDDGKYSFESAQVGFDKCNIMDDPRVLFRT